MCFLVSLAPGQQRLLSRDVRIPILVETLLCDSAARQVLVGCDVVVQNSAAQPVELFLTHPDDVDGRLATADWFHVPRPRPDERAELVQQVYGKYWDLDKGRRTLRFVNPVTCPIGGHDPTKADPALALSYWPPGYGGPGVHISAENLAGYDDYHGTYSMRRFPEAGGRPRPFSAFRFNIPRYKSVFFRLTVVIARDAYDRLIDRHNGPATFEVVGPDQVQRRLDRALSHGPEHVRPFKEFYDSLRDGHIEPEHYHILLAQPDDNPEEQHHPMLVRFGPTSPVVRELYILDDDARDRAAWFTAVSGDFRILLQYQARPDRRLTRRDFCRRI